MHAAWSRDHLSLAEVSNFLQEILLLVLLVVCVGVRCRVRLRKLHGAGLRVGSLRRALVAACECMYKKK